MTRIQTMRTHAIALVAHGQQLKTDELVFRLLLAALILAGGAVTVAANLLGRSDVADVAGAVALSAVLVFYLGVGTWPAVQNSKR